MIQRIKIENEAQWLDLRKDDVTASDISALWGLNPYKTIANLFYEKLGGISMGPKPGSPVIRRGRALEQVVADEVKRLHPEWEITKADVYLRDPDIRIGCTPDFFVTDPAREGVGVLQTKTVGSLQFKKEWTDSEPPAWIALQVATEMMLNDSKWGVIAALVIGDFVFDLKVYNVEWYAPAEMKLKAGVRDFWKKIEEREEPDIDYSRDGELLRLLHPKEVPGKIIDLTFDNAILDLLERRAMLKTAHKAAEDQITAVENEIKGKLGDAESATVRGWRLTFKTINKKGFTVEPTSYRHLYAKKEKP